MDRNRLKEIHQTDLTESKINEDFVDWLKTKGPTWLLVVLIGLAAWLLIDRFRQRKQDHLTAGWSAFLSAQLPGSLEDVAADYADIHGLSVLANLRAADVCLQAVIAQAPLGADLRAATVEPLSDEDRDTYLTRAERIYQAVIDADNQSPETALYTIAAMNGQAAVAESQRGVESAATGAADCTRHCRSRTDCSNRGQQVWRPFAAVSSGRHLCSPWIAHCQEYDVRLGVRCGQAAEAAL